MSIRTAELRQIPFLARIPEEELEPWENAATRYQVQRRETLVTPGDELRSLYLVARGLVMLCQQARSDETRMTTLVDGAQCFNIQCLHPRIRATEAAHALTDAEVIAIPAEIVRESVRRGGALAVLLSGFAAGRLAELMDDYVRATTLDVRSRTAVALLRLIDRLETVNIPLTQEQLAGLVGTRRETLALILGAYRNESVIDTRYRMIKVLDRDALHAASGWGYPACIDHALPWPLTADTCLPDPVRSENTLRRK